MFTYVCSLMFVEDKIVFLIFVFLKFELLYKWRLLFYHLIIILINNQHSTASARHKPLPIPAYLGSSSEQFFLGFRSTSGWSSSVTLAGTWSQFQQPCPSFFSLYGQVLSPVPLHYDYSHNKYLTLRFFVAVLGV